MLIVDLEEFAAGHRPHGSLSSHTGRPHTERVSPGGRVPLWRDLRAVDHTGGGRPRPCSSGAMELDARDGVFVPRWRRWRPGLLRVNS
jgi:hypothetical protein